MSCQGRADLREEQCVIAAKHSRSTLLQLSVPMMTELFLRRQRCLEVNAFALVTFTSNQNPVGY